MRHVAQFVAVCRNRARALPDGGKRRFNQRVQPVIAHIVAGHITAAQPHHIGQLALPLEQQRQPTRRDAAPGVAQVVAWVLPPVERADEPEAPVDIRQQFALRLVVRVLVVDGDAQHPRLRTQFFHFVGVAGRRRRDQIHVETTSGKVTNHVVVRGGGTAADGRVLIVEHEQTHDTGTLSGGLALV